MQTVYEADDGIVVINFDGTVEWYWDNGEEDGTYILNFEDDEEIAAEFDAYGREDIAKLFRTKTVYSYGYVYEW